MKKILALAMAALMLITMAGCGAGPAGEDTAKVGILGMNSLNGAKRQAEGETVEQISYNNLTSALMDLQNGKIVQLHCEKTMADYIAARNENVEIVENASFSETSFSMMTLDTNKEDYYILNNGIKAITADGTLEKLIKDELKAHTEKDPAAALLPEFEGADTIKIGITGDLPPMDFVSADGKAAGFNVALLTEIANREKINFELIQIETSARAMALSTGKVDAVFWSKTLVESEGGATITENPEGTLLTEKYFTDTPVAVRLTADK